MPNKPQRYFAKKLIAWQQQYGRKHLPWQQQPNAYRIWLSEIMLQQTQYQTVIPYFERFMQAFPTVHALANAHIDQVLHLWSGLGYYARARNLHQTAQQIVTNYQGQFPSTIDELTQLPGIGRSTAGAILAFSRNEFAVILDGNVKRVLARYFAITEDITSTATTKQLWQLATELTPRQQTNIYTQAIMDLGAMICTRSQPKCQLCPLIDDCQAKQQQLTSNIPHKKKKKPLPNRHAAFILYTHQGHVLLEQRPASGLWGGLWCFPEIEFSALNKQQHPGKIKQQQVWDTFRHSFSHFHLHITPVKIELTELADTVRDSAQQQWFQIDQLPAKGLAKPVANLLQRLQEDINDT